MSKRRAKYLKMSSNTTSMNELLRTTENTARLLYVNNDNDLGTYVKTNLGWLFVSKDDYVKEAGIDYYQRSTDKYFYQLVNTVPITYEGNKDRSEFAQGNIAFRSKTYKAKILFTIVIIAFIGFEFLVLALQYLEVAMSLSNYWHDSLKWLIDKLSIVNFEIKGGWYIATVLLIAMLNIPILITITVLIWYKKIKFSTDSKLSTIILIILIFPFFMSFGIFSVPIMKLLLETYNGVINSQGVRVLKRYTLLKGETSGQVLLFILALITMIIQLISSVVFLSLTKEDGIFDENGMLIDKRENTDQLHDFEVLEEYKPKTNRFGIFKFICQRKRFKKGIKYLPATSFGIQVILLLIGVYSPKDEWWPGAMGDIVLVFVIAYFIKKHPYADSRYNHWSIALYFHNFYSFLRTFFINSFPHNHIIVKIATYSIFFSPFSLLLGYSISILRGYGLHYDESDDYDEIDTKSDAKNKKNLKYANTIIDKIIELKLGNLKIQAIRIKYTNKQRVIAHGIFHGESDVGLLNATILLAHLGSDRMHKPIYFTKISFGNVEPEDSQKEVINEHTVYNFALLFFGSVFRYLSHLEFHNYIMYEESFFYMIGLLKNNPTLEVLNVANNSIVGIDEYFNNSSNNDSELPLVKLVSNSSNKSIKSHKNINYESVDSSASSSGFESNRIYGKIWEILKDNKNLRRII